MRNGGRERLRLAIAIHRRTGFEQSLDRRFGKARFPQNLDAVLTEPWLQTRHRCRGVAKTHRLIGEQNLAFAWMRRALEEAGCLKLRIAHYLVEARYPCRRNFKLAQQREPFVGRLFGERGAGEFVKRDDVAAARRGAVETRIVANLWSAHRAPEFAPLHLGIGHHADITVARLVRPAPGSEYAGIAERTLRRREAMTKQMLSEHEGNHGFEHRHFDELSASGFLAREQRRRHRVRQCQRSGLVGEDGRRIARLAGDLGHQRGDAGLALDDIVISRLPAIRSAAAITVQAGIDDARVARAYDLMPEAKPIDLLRSHRMDKHIGAIDQTPQRLSGCWLLEIEHERALAAI